MWQPDIAINIGTQSHIISTRMSTNISDQVFGSWKRRASFNLPGFDILKHENNYWEIVHSWKFFCFKSVLNFSLKFIALQIQLRY